MSRFLKPRTIGFLLILVFLAALTFGFADNNTFTGTPKAGFGETAVSGYAVTVSWTINSGNPLAVTQASLVFDTAPGQVWASVYEDTSGDAPWCDASTYGAWIDCGSGSPATCTYAGNIQGICGIRVSAVD
jgi:hypothetical protein